MSFVPAILLAAAAFAVAALLLRLPRGGWALFGAALLFGLTGYAMQGSAGQGGAPKAPAPDMSETGEAMVAARRQMFESGPPSRFVTVADGFARRGRYADAARMLNGAVNEDPEDTEAWLALGNALVEHADGQLTPAALYAYGRAERLSPEHPGAPFFLGVSLIRRGRLLEARQLWAELLDRAPPEAAWRSAIEERLERLDQLVMQTGGG